MSFELPGRPAPPSSDSTDAELVLALQAGQTAALGILYDRHAGLVYGLAMRSLGNPQEAEDLTQDIFLTLARGCSYDSNRGSLRTFLAILTRSRAIDRLRSRSTASDALSRLRWHESSPLSAAATDQPLESVVLGERSQQVQSALAQLSDEQQQILRLAYYDGLSQSEIAQQLNLPLGTVKGRSRRGLLKLRQFLSDVLG